MLKTKRSGNGSKSFGGSNPLDMDTDEIFGTRASFSNIDGESATKYFMDAPKDFQTSLLRSMLPDVKFRNAVILSWERYDRWDDRRHKEMLLNMLLATRAEKGFASIQAQQVAIGILAEQLMLHMTGQKLSKEEREKMQHDLDRQWEAKNGARRSDV